MKALLNGLALAILLISTHDLLAQQHPGKKQPVFLKSAERIAAPVLELEKAFKVTEGTNVDFRFSEMQITGTVLSSVKRYDNLYSVIVKSDENTLISLSKRINVDKSVTYLGRIINNRSSDGYELKKNTDGTYTLEKVETEDLIQDY